MKAVVAVVVALCVAVGADVQCRKDWDLGNGDRSCYKMMNFRTTWAEAFMYCTVMRSHLVDISSQFEQDSIAEIIKNKYSHYYEQFWIDLTDLSTENEWRHMTFFTKPNFTTWIEGHMNNWQGAEHCAHINAKSFRNYKWNDHKCQTELNFICETYPTTA